MSIEEKIIGIIAQIKHRMNGSVVESMKVEGIEYKENYGVTIPELREIALPFKGDHELALRLFEIDIRECKIIASIIDDPKKVTGEQIDDWSSNFENIEIVEQLCSNLFYKSDFALTRSIEWCIQDDALYQKAGLLIVGKRASDQNLTDSIFEPYTGIIENLCETEDELVKNSALFALREIAKRSNHLKDKVISTAERMTVSDFEIASWVGNQLLFELTEE
jgi:3-methyladenine DNA glycosylase AlkD